MRLQNILLGVLIVSLVSCVVGLILYDGLTYYSSSTSYDNNDLGIISQFDKLNQTYEITVQSGSSISGSGSQFSQEGIDVNDKLKVSSINSFFKSVTMMPSLINETAIYLGVPTPIIWILLTALVIVIIMSVIAFVGSFFGGGG